MAIGEKFSFEDHSRMLRLREEILARLYEERLIIDRNIGEAWPKKSGEGIKKEDIKPFRGPVINMGDETYIIGSDWEMIENHKTGTCVIYDLRNAECRNC